MDAPVRIWKRFHNNKKACAMSKQPTRDIIGSSSIILPPTQKQRNWNDALTMGGLVFGATTILSTALLWKLPGLGGPLPAFLWNAKGMAAEALHPLIGLFGATAQEHQAFMAQLPLATKLGMAWRATIGLAAGGWLGFQTARSSAIPRDALIHHRGRRLLDGQEAIDDALRATREEIDGDARDICILSDPKKKVFIPLSCDRMTKHILLFGGTGSGKTTALLPMIDQAVRENHRTLIWDIKGDFTAKYGPAEGFQQAGRASVMAPWDARSIIWDIARDCETRQDARELAARLITASKDPMWSNAARQVLVGFIVSLQQRGIWWGWRDLAELLADPDDKKMAAIMRDCNPEALRIAEGADTTKSGIMINLVAFVSIVFDLAEAWGDALVGDPRLFSFKEWLSNPDVEKRQVILKGSGQFSQLASSYAGSAIALMTAFINSDYFPNDSQRRIYFFLDEFPQLGKVDFQPLVEIGRSKGVRVILGAQDINQIKKIYSPEDASALMSMCSTHLYCRVAPGDTVKMISEFVGKREVERPNYSTTVQDSGRSVSHSYAREEIPVITESQLQTELGVRKSQRLVRSLLVGLGENALILEWPFPNIPDVAPAGVPAQWIFGKRCADSADDYLFDLWAEQEEEEKRQRTAQGKTDNAMAADGAQAKAVSHKIDMDSIDAVEEQARRQEAEEMGHAIRALHEERMAQYGQAANASVQEHAQRRANAFERDSQPTPQPCAAPECDGPEDKFAEDKAVECASEAIGLDHGAASIAHLALDLLEMTPTRKPIQPPTPRR